MRKAHNKIEPNKEIERKIRNLFTKQVEFTEITKQTGIKEFVLRRIIREHKWTELRERYWQKLCWHSYVHSTPLCKLCEERNIKYYSVCRIRKKYNILKAQRFAWNDKRTEDIEKEIVKLYESGLTASRIIDRFGYKRKETIYQILEKHNVERREPKIQTYYNESFFEKINSHDKAYILGLIMTDGYIIKDYDGFGIQLTEKDGYILEKIRDLVGGTNPITKIDCSHKRKHMPGAKDMARLHVFSKKIAQDLKKLGVIRRKTKTLRYNGCVPKKYLDSFFRGMIDGDGSIGVDGRGYYFWTLASASCLFLEDLERTYDFSFLHGYGKSVDTLRVGGGQKEIRRMYKWMYKNKGDLYLRRKYDKVQNQIS